VPIPQGIFHHGNEATRASPPPLPKTMISCSVIEKPLPKLGDLAAVFCDLATAGTGQPV